MDIKDRRIIYELLDDSSQSYAQIGKKVGLSKETVFHRVKKMEKSKVIVGYRPKLDYSLLGYYQFEVYIKFYNLHDSKTAKLIRDLHKNRNVITIQHEVGPTDMLIRYNTRNPLKFFQFLYRICSSSIGEVDYYLITTRSYFPSKQLVLDKPTISYIRPAPSENTIKLSEEDILLIRELFSKEKTSFVELSKKLKTPVNKVSYRYNKLKKIGIIKGLRATIGTVAISQSLEPYGVQKEDTRHTSFKVLPKDRNKFIETCTDHPAVDFMREVVNPNYDFIIETVGIMPYTKVINELCSSVPGVKVVNQFTRKGDATKKKGHPF